MQLLMWPKKTLATSLTNNSYNHVYESSLN